MNVMKIASCLCRLGVSPGDVVGLTLTDKRTITVSHNGTEVPLVFKSLPKRKLWVAIKIHVKRIEMEQGIH